MSLRNFRCEFLNAFDFLINSGGIERAEGGSALA